MRAYVHSDFTLVGNTLHDSYLGVRYLLTPDTAWVMAQLLHCADVDILTRRIAQHAGIAEGEARNAAYTLLGFLGALGASWVRWDIQTNLGFKLRALMVWHRRYVGSWSGFTRAMGRAYGLLVVILTTLFMIAWLVLGDNFSPLWMAAPALLFASCVVHEAGHALVARVYGVRFVHIAHLMYAGVMYVRPHDRTARRIALCGPLAAIVPCVLLTLWCDIWPVRALAVLTGVIHGLSLLPGFADGNTIWRRNDKTSK
jgi:hypothetical protein